MSTEDVPEDLGVSPADDLDGADDLRRLARLWGVATRFRDGFGRRREPSRETLVAVLDALGAPVGEGSPSDVKQALARLCRDRAARTLPPSAVAWDGVCPVIPLTVPSSAATVPVDGRLVFEAGEAVPFRLDAEQTPVTARRRADGRDLVRRRVRLADPVPPGHHRLEIEMADHRADMRLVSAPRSAHPGPDHAWGLFLPLHALRGQPEGGLGNLGLLTRFAGWAGSLGASAVGCLPLLAAFVDAGQRPFDPSPYAPASRLFWNELWVDLAAVPELAECRVARERLSGADTVARRRELVAGEGAERVAYGAERAWRRPVWQALADHFFTGAGDSRRERLETLRRVRPELDAYASFRGVGDRLGTPWQEWPEDLRAGEPPEEVDPTAEHSQHYRRHLYAQLVAHEQIGKARERADADGVALYLDLPLGVHSSSFDVWRHRGEFAENVAAGAPPDAFFVRGQNWGFPPLSPRRLWEGGAAHFRAVLAHSMSACSLLRLDHAMQLERLFWIPEGAEPTEGTYVRYPREELLATLVLESRSARCAVVGEDLGTVPDSLRRALDRHGVARMFVVPFELQPNPFRALSPVPERALATLGTHDTATFAGFWRGRDLELRRELELLSEPEAEHLDADREILRHALVAYLRSRGRLPRIEEPEPEQVGRAVLEELAVSPASWLLVNLEDLWGEEEPQNVPGTGPERPNWRRRARKSLAELWESAEIRSFLRDLDGLRRSRAGSETGVMEVEGGPEGGTGDAEGGSAP